MTEENPRIFLNNTYGGDKALTEDLLLNSKKVFPVTVFRPQGVIGPYDPRFVGLIFYRIINRLPILIGKNTNVQSNIATIILGVVNISATIISNVLIDR